jgi:Flp pilus assembly protein TadG
MPRRRPSSGPRRCSPPVATGSGVRHRSRPPLASPDRGSASGRGPAPDRGSATTELVILTPLLVALLLFVVLCGRLVSAQLDLNAAAHSAARAASLARTPPAATADAEQAALDTLAARQVTCAQPTITVNTGGLTPGGAVTVTVTCVVPLSDLTLIAVPGTRTVQATSTSPVDLWRGTP